MSKLKVDKKGNILREDKSVLGAPIRTGKIYRSGARTGRIDLETGKVYNLKEQELGEIDLSLFGTLFDDKIAKLKEAKAKEERKVAREAKKKGVIPTKSESKHQEEKKNVEYIPGKDSYLIVTGRLDKILWPYKFNTENSDIFNSLNSIKNNEFSNWIQLSAKANLTDTELIKYQHYIDWYTYLKFHPEKVLPECLSKYKTYMKD